MDKSDFNFKLPPELIAQTPATRREQSRLLCLDRITGETRHDVFSHLPQLLREGDCLVLNDSRVMPARLFGRRETGGAAEVLLLREMREIGEGVWECLTKPGAKTGLGARLAFGDGELAAVIIGVAEDGSRLIKFECVENGSSGFAAEAENGKSTVSLNMMFEKLGKMPLPPYIREEPEDIERYQTVYSRVTGSAAAPTAGLHFTNELLDEISERGVEICFMTLHVGVGTFRPVKANAIEEHRMHSEFFAVPQETALSVNRAKANGGRVIAVGTTSCRALETCSDEAGHIVSLSGFTDIFIYPGYRFKCIDGLITNFHLPESTLIMLVSAFAGHKPVMHAYDVAIENRYRFFSFGDAMLIV